MIYPLFCIRDVKVGFGQPQIYMSEQVAIRDFAFKINEPNSLLDFIPQDFDFYRVGTFNTESGEIKTELPTFVKNGKDVYGDSYGEIRR